MTGISLPSLRPLLVCLSTLASAAGLFANTIVVTTAQDQLDDPSGPEVSLKEALRDAGDGAATICFDPSLSGAIFRLNGLGLRIMSSTGSPVGAIVIDASALDEPPIIRPGNNPNNVILVNGADRDITFKNLVFADGQLANSAMFLSRGVFTMEDCVVRGNVEEGLSVNSGDLHLRRCVFHDNLTGVVFNGGGTAKFDDCLFYHHWLGAAQFTVGLDTNLVQLLNCTIAENSALESPPHAALEIRTANLNASPTVVLNHCSIVDNSTIGVLGPTDMIIQNTLFARNFESDGVPHSILEGSFGLFDYGADSRGYNVADDSPASLDAPSDQVNTDAQVSRLGYFGGRALVCFPLAGSPAIDGGNPNRVALIPAFDARGFRRNASNTFVPNNNPVDIGAVETNPNGAFVVTSVADSGPNTLRALIASAVSHSGETFHITIDPSLNGQTLTLEQVVDIEATCNLNIDGSALRTPLTISGDFEGNFFNLSSNQDDRLMGSLTGLRISGFSFTGIGRRSPINLSGGTRFGLQRLVIADNAPAAGGAVDVSDGSTAWINECLFENNRQVTNRFPADGGAALTVRSSRVSAWNSTFLGNVSDWAASADGGAVLIDPTGKGEFLHCTFARNSASDHGSCLIIREVMLGGIQVGGEASLTRCTFSENDAGEGAVAVDGTARIQIGASVFYRNENSEAGTEATVDFFSGAGSFPNVVRDQPNWTDATQSSNQAVHSSGLGLDFELAAPGSHGGFVPTCPFVGNPPDDNSIRIFFAYPRDAHNEYGFSRSGAGGSPTAVAGAVQRVLAAPPVAQLRIVEVAGNELRFEADTPPGTRWQLESGSDLVTMTPTAQIFEAGGLEAGTLTLSTPRPPELFIQLRKIE